MTVYDTQPVTDISEDGGVSERPVVFSASSVNSYLACHLQWYFSYVLVEESEQTEPQAVGIAVHDFAEKILTQKTLTPTWAMPLPKDISPLAEVFMTDILPTYRDPVLIEAEFQLEVNGIPFSGIIDSVDRHRIGPLENGDEWDANILRDLKTTGSRPSAGKYRFAMTGYWLGATDLGFPPDAAQLDWIVRTKNPYYWPEVMDPITDDDINIFAATLERAAEGVAGANYEPTGLGTRSCSWCGYKAICGPYQRLQEVST